jgi:DTW domain-containing protein YfiP
MFAILMHPKEYKYIKNNTGRLTHLSLENSKLFVGVDFSNHNHVNALIEDTNNHCVILYPSNDSICINEEKLELDGKNLVIFIIDATWDSAKPILRLSKNLHNLPRISFTHTKTSAYSFKRQPFVEALSTMESTGCVLEILKKQDLESISFKELENFLNPFKEMIKFQMEFVSSKPRFRSSND